MASVLRRRVAAAPQWFDVDGPSMGDTIPSGSRVLVAAAARPRRGEIWAFCLPAGNLVVHRYRRLVDGRHCFQGDAMRWADEPVPAELLVGRVQAVETQGAQRTIGTREALRGRLRLDVEAVTRRVRALWRSRR